MPLIDRLNRLFGEYACYLYLAAVVVTTYGAVMPYLFNAPTSWAFELTVLMCGICYLLSGGFVTGQRKHIAITALYDLASPKLKWHLDIIAMTGIIGGEVALLGLIALPQMLKLKYDPPLAIGTICTGGSLGTMIPPSVVLILYGLTANVSISDLFLAGITPGLLLRGLYIGYIILRCWLNPALGPPRPGRRPRDAVVRKGRPSQGPGPASDDRHLGVG